VNVRELAAPFSSIVQATIHLFAGSHYIVDSRSNPLLFYDPIKAKSDENQNFKLILKPLRCDVFQPTSGQCLQPNSEDNVKIFNKQRERLRIGVGAALTLDHVTIDSLDSILQTRTLGTPKPSCLNEHR
jgi:hypothetical protein